MEWVFFGVFSILAAIIFNYVNPKVSAMSWAQGPSASGYIGKTLVTGAAFFVVLIVAGLLMSAVTGKRELTAV
jgi:hypothetical protein